MKLLEDELRRLVKNKVTVNVVNSNYVIDVRGSAIFQNEENISGDKNNNKYINMRFTYFLNQPKIGELKHVPDIVELLYFK
jgi:hypothetical protein